MILACSLHHDANMPVTAGTIFIFLDKTNTQLLSSSESVDWKVIWAVSNVDYILLPRKVQRVTLLMFIHLSSLLISAKLQ